MQNAHRQTKQNPIHFFWVAKYLAVFIFVLGDSLFKILYLKEVNFENWFYAVVFFFLLIGFALLWKCFSIKFEKDGFWVFQFCRRPLKIEYSQINNLTAGQFFLNKYFGFYDLMISFDPRSLPAPNVEKFFGFPFSWGTTIGYGHLVTGFPGLRNHYLFIPSLTRKGLADFLVLLRQNSPGLPAVQAFSFSHSLFDNSQKILSYFFGILLIAIFLMLVSMLGLYLYVSWQLGR